MQGNIRARLSQLFDQSTWDRLVEAASIPAVIEQLRETPFARPLENAMERYQQEGRLFHLEIALDLFYFQKLVRLIDAQSGKDAAAATHLTADLIIMGHTGRRGTTRVLIGSVTERVLDYAPCPVLVMK